MVARPTDEVGRPDLRTSIEELYFMTVSAAITVTINANESKLKNIINLLIRVYF